MTESTPRRGRPRKEQQLAAPEKPVEQEKTPEQLELEALRAELEALKEQSERDRRELAAINVETSTAVPQELNTDDYIVIHFLQDGHTAFDRVWRRGQEVHIKKNGRAYETTVNMKGESWLDLSDAEQLKRYKKVVFRKGPVTPDIMSSYEYVEDIKDVKLSKDEYFGEKVLAKLVFD